MNVFKFHLLYLMSAILFYENCVQLDFNVSIVGPLKII